MSMFTRGDGSRMMVRLVGYDGRGEGGEGSGGGWRWIMVVGVRCEV